MRNIENIDREVSDAIESDLLRQKNKINLIASENYVSKAVLEAQGSCMTNKYAEGYPRRRYYGGCEFVDEVEDLAIKRAKNLFKADHANVQLHSGSQANMAVYFAMLDLKDTILSMDLSHGGHLSHGSPVSFSGKYFDVKFYGVDKETERINYDSLLKLAKKVKPNLIVCGASAYPREIDFGAFREIADEVGAYLMADIAHIAGLIVAGEHQSPVPYADFVTTTTHKTLRGARGGMILCKREYAKKIDKMVFPGIQGGPLMHAIAAKAITFKEAMSDSFREYQKQIVINAKCLADELSNLDFRIVSGGTDNHLMLIDLTDKGMTGKEAEESLEKENIILNKNTIPFETKSPFITSGIRIGTPCVTTRGMGKEEMKEIAQMIADVLLKKKSIKDRVERLCRKYPIYE